MKKNRVVICGVGPIGAKISEFISERNSFEITGAVDIAPDKVGRDLGEFFNPCKIIGVPIEKRLKKVLEGKKVDVVVLTTVSSLAKIKDTILEILSYGVNIVSTCEELSYPWITAPETAKEIDTVARENRVSILSTGINPGFLMDFLPLIMTGVCRNITHIMIERIQNAANRRVPFQQKVGIGITVEEFYKRVDAGTIRHVGLTESIHMISSRIGWKLDKTIDTIEPVIAEENITVNGRVIEKGLVLGAKQTGIGFLEGRELITLHFKAAAGISSSYDRILIKGVPEIDSTIINGVNGDIASCAIITNAIPVIVKATPGLKTMVDIEPITFFV